MKTNGQHPQTHIRMINDSRGNNNNVQTMSYQLMQGIVIGIRWKITSDRYNVIVWRKEGKKKPRWRTQGYFISLENALHFLVLQRVHHTRLTNLQVVIDEIKEIRTDISKTLEKIVVGGNNNQ
jgi:hypothetical protein